MCASKVSLVRHGSKTRKCATFSIVLATFIGYVCGRTANIYRGESSLADTATTTEMMKYLTNFGYIQPSTNGVAQLQTAEELSNAVKMMQKIGGVPETGVLDDETAAYILRPRCGVSDLGLIDRLRRTRRKRRYTIAGYGKWNKRTLTWTLKRPSPKVSESRTIQELQAAFKLWSDGSGLKFQRVSATVKADIELDFFRRGHYDANSFDGEGGILGHAFYPVTSYAGAVHFDDDENWTTHEEAKNGAVKSVSLFYVAAHELGHTLGLDHSDDTDSLMVGSYPGPKDLPELPDDDLRAIRYLYGGGRDDSDRDRTPFFERPVTTLRPTTTTRTRYRPTRGPVRPTHPPTNRPRLTPDICPLTFDTIASVRGEIFLFKDEHMWRINSRDEIFGPSLTHTFWMGLPKDLKKVDSVYERQTRGSNIMFFIDRQYWAFDGNNLIPGYPRPLTDLGLPANLERIDATLVWGHNGKTYFFSGDQYWKFNETKNGVDADYPRDLTAWQGVPQDVTSAIRWKGGDTYFFKGKVFWKFDNSKMAVEHKAGRLSVPYWIECLGTAHGAGTNEDPLRSSESTPLTSGSIGKRNAHLIVVNLVLFFLYFLC